MQLVDDGRLFRELRTWYQGDPVSSGALVKPYEEALAEARRRLANAEAYELRVWSWGYKESVDDGGQAGMSIFYEFAFVPRDTLSRAVHPPQLIEVAAAVDVV